MATNKGYWWHREDDTQVVLTKTVGLAHEYYKDFHCSEFSACFDNALQTLYPKMWAFVDGNPDLDPHFPDRLINFIEWLVDGADRSDYE